MKRQIFFLLVMIIVLAGCSRNEEILSIQETKTEASTLKSATLLPAGKMVQDEILIKFKKGITEAKRSEIHGKVGGKDKEKIKTKMMEKDGDTEGISVVTITGTVAEALSKVKGLPDVEFAEPNFLYTHDAVLTSNDPYYTNGSLWGMNGTYGCQAQVAWGNNHTGSATVYVGLIDEGYMYTHEDLAANVGKNPKEIAGNKIDDDKNGYVDDVYGWDFVDKNGTIFDGVGDDHGTHVAGTIGGVGGNKIGVAGVCWNVKILSAKFLGKNGGTTADAIKAVDYFTELKKAGVNIVATNNSWGGGGFSQGLKDAITRANAAGILFVCAAGNDGTNNDVTASYPSNYDVPNVIAVAAITKTGALASWSQYGLTTVDLGAPGEGIYSTVPVKSGKNVTSGYTSYSGTSMATPHVTGACALYKAANPGATAAQIKAAILSKATATTSLAGKCVTGGRLNVSTF